MRAELTIGVMEFVGKGGISQDKADVLANMLAEEISRMGDVHGVRAAVALEVAGDSGRREPPVPAMQEPKVAALPVHHF